MRKYVDSSIGQRTPSGTYTNEPSENTAELSVAKKLSEVGTTEPRYFLTISGCSRIASEIGMKITPAFFSSSLNVVATETESNTASTATLRPADPCSASGRTTPSSTATSRKGMPSF